MQKITITPQGIVLQEVQGRRDYSSSAELLGQIKGLRARLEGMALPKGPLRTLRDTTVAALCTAEEGNVPEAQRYHAYAASLARSGDRQIKEALDVLACYLRSPLRRMEQGVLRTYSEQLQDATLQIPSRVPVESQRECKELMLRLAATYRKASDGHDVRADLQAIPVDADALPGDLKDTFLSAYHLLSEHAASLNPVTVRTETSDGDLMAITMRDVMHLDLHGAPQAHQYAREQVMGAFLHSTEAEKALHEKRFLKAHQEANVARYQAKEAQAQHTVTVLHIAHEQLSGEIEDISRRIPQEAQKYHQEQQLECRRLNTITGNHLARGHEQVASALKALEGQQVTKSMIKNRAALARQHARDAGKLGADPKQVDQLCDTAQLVDALADTRWHA